MLGEVRRPRLVLFGLFLLSAVIRVVVATQRTTPLYYPDEYLYASLSRAIATAGVPTVRGASAHFPALLGPYLVAPAWLIQDVGIAYHVALGLGAVAFSAAVFPAYRLARTIGVSMKGSLVVSAFAVAVPGGAFATTLLMEPFAYPVFILMLVVAVETLARPTHSRQIAVLALMLALSLIRIQFVVVGPLYLLTSWICSGSIRGAARRQPIVAVASVAISVALLVLGVGNALGVYAGITSYSVDSLSVAHWSILNVFVLAVAAGWVVVPAAVLGFGSLLRSSRAVHRSFAVYSLALIAGLTAEAAFFGAAEHRAHERYAFYCAPILVAAFMWALEHSSVGRLYRYVAYSLAAAAIVLPLGKALDGAVTDESPSLLGLHALGGGGRSSSVIWATSLATLALLTAFGAIRRRILIGTAFLCVLAVGVAGTHQLLGFGTSLGFQLGTNVQRVPRIDVPDGSAILTTAQSNRFLLMETLFWNRHVSRVLVLGHGSSPDGYTSTNVRFNGAGHLVDSENRAIASSVVVDDDTTIVTPANAIPGETIPAKGPFLLMFGLNRDDQYLQTVGHLLAVTTRRPQVITFQLRSVSNSNTLQLVCAHRRKIVTVTPREGRLRVVIPPSSVSRCRLSLIRGLPVSIHNRTVGAYVEGVSMRPHAQRKS